MPNRVGHQQLTLAASLVAMPTILFMPDLVAYAAFEAGILVTLIPEFTPDLDISHRKFDGLKEFIGLRSYAKLIPHRYGLRRKHWTRLRIWNIFFLSHVPFVGTAFRTMLLCLPILVLGLLLATLLENYFDWLLSQSLWLLLWLWLGMGWSDYWHVVADIVTSDFKQIKREVWYGKRTDRRRFYRKSKPMDD